MTPELFWEQLENNLNNQNRSLPELSRELKEKGVRVNIWDYRRRPQYLPLSALKHLKQYLNDDIIYEALIHKDPELKKEHEMEAFLFSLNPSRSIIQEQRMRRKLQRKLGALNLK